MVRLYALSRALSRVACAAAVGRFVVGARSAPERCGSGLGIGGGGERRPKVLWSALTVRLRAPHHP